MAETAEDVAVENWKVVRSFLPAGWEERARTSGALRRARDIGDAESLLRVLLLHVGNGYSLAETAVHARQIGVEVSPVAVFKRLRASEEWLRWLAAELRGAKRRVALPSEGRAVRAVDATTVSEPGSTGTDWRVHYAINLADLQCDFFELTDVKGGETLRRVPVHRGDIIIGDRGYAMPPAVAHVHNARADLIVRLNRQALPVFDSLGRTLELLSLCRRLKIGDAREWSARVKDPAGGWVAGRLIALKRSVSATRATRRHLQRKASRQQQPLSPAAWEAAQYFSVWTSLPRTFSANDVLELYRLRWQIELAFKRMKSILSLGHLPKTDPTSARAWLHGKIFVSLLVERMVEAAESFSPWGYQLSSAPQPVEGN